MAAKKPYVCGIGPAFEVIGGKWKALRELETDGVVAREVFHEVPPRVEYSETKLGATLNAALGPLADWGDRYAKRVEAARKQSEAARQG